MGCFTGSAQGTVLSIKSDSILHTKGPTDSLSRVLVLSKSSEYFRKQEKDQLKHRKPKTTQGYKQTPVPAELQEETRHLPA